MAGYYPNGQLSQLLYGNGVAFSSTQNTRLLPASYAYSGAGTTLLAEGYTYDADGNLTQSTDQQGGNDTRSYAYDALNRLTRAVVANGWGEEDYGYDPLNNLRTAVQAGQTLAFGLDGSYRTNAVLMGNTPYTTYQYDARGNRAIGTVNGVTTTYSYDAKNQLLSIGGTASYAYDEAGRRVQKTLANGQSTASFYAPDGELMYTVSGGVLTKYVYLASRLVARNVGGAITYLQTDRQGTPVRETNAAGTVTQSFRYRPYGQLYSGALQSQPGYTGHMSDAESGYTYMQARYYDAGLERQMSPDPVYPTAGNLFNFNRYAYANDNPIDNTDPTGRDSVGEIIDENAQAAADSGNNVATYGWAFAGAVWGALGAESVSQVADKGSAASTSDKVIAAASIVTLGKGEEAVTVAKDVGEAAKGVAKEAVSMSEAVDKAIAHTGSDAEVGMTKGGNVQFSKSVSDQSGNTITKNARFDVNPANAHVQKQGPHLNIETQQNGKVIQNDHIPIDPKTIRPGDHDW